MDTAAAQQIRNTDRRRTTTDAAAESETSNNNRRHIPRDMVDTILMQLPLKSVYRFSRVSKRWESLFFDPSFMKTRAAVRGVRRLLMSPHPCHPWYDPRLDLADASSCPLSSISSEVQAVEDATAIVFPIEGKPILRASCGELWCVEVNNSLYLWNPSIDVCKKLPNPFPSVWNSRNLIYGLGYDSVSDDYKFFKLEWNSVFGHTCELYSLRSDSWRTIDHQPLSRRSVVFPNGVFVAGALHWLIFHEKCVIFFDLAKEKYGYIASPTEKLPLGRAEVSSLRGKLCVHNIDNWPNLGLHIVIWVMEEYGVEKSWTKIFDIKNGDGIPLNPDRGRPPVEVKPLYLFDNGEILFRVCIHKKNYALFMYKGEGKTPWEMVCGGISNGFVYEESLFSPLKFEKLDVAKKQRRGRSLSAAKKHGRGRSLSAAKKHGRGRSLNAAKWKKFVCCEETSLGQSDF